MQGVGQPAKPAVSTSDLEFRSLLEKIPAAAYTCDADGLITFYNNQAVELWGRSPKLNDRTDRFCGSFRLFSTDGAPIVHEQCWMALALRDDKGYNGHEIIIERPNGTRCTALAYANPIHEDREGSLTGAVNVLVDITDRKRNEDLLRDADRHKNAFLAILAHELRNPLAPIRNAVQLLQLQGPKEPRLQWAREVIDRQVNHLERLIEDLIDVSRITRNRLELRKERVSLSVVIQSAVEASRPLFEGNRHELSLKLAEEDLVLEADLVRLSQVFTNILNNACKYTPPGGRIAMTARRDGGAVLVSVEDSGIGIEPEKLPRLFEMFYQAEHPFENSQGGLGIGLSLVRHLVELHGGLVTARSAGVGRGSEFIVQLPVVSEQTLSPSAAAGAGHDTTKERRRRILVVDDNQDGAISLAMLLEAIGHQVATAFNGLEALKVASRIRPDVVLLDIGIPGLNGYEVARRIREEPWGKATVLIAITGWGQLEDRERSKDVGFDDHFVKPLDFTRLKRLLAEPAPEDPFDAGLSGTERQQPRSWRPFSLDLENVSRREDGPRRIRRQDVDGGSLK